MGKKGTFAFNHGQYSEKVEGSLKTQNGSDRGPNGGHAASICGGPPKKILEFYLNFVWKCMLLKIGTTVIQWVFMFSLHTINFSRDEVGASAPQHHSIASHQSDRNSAEKLACRLPIITPLLASNSLPYGIWDCFGRSCLGKK